MGTTRIKVIDLAADVEQIKTSRKRAQTAAVGKIKKPLVGKKTKGKPAQTTVESQKQVEIQIEKIPQGVVKVKVSKPKFTQKRAKKYQSAKLLVDAAKFYPIDMALELVKKVNIASFDGSVEVHIAVKQKGLRGFVTLPHPVKKQSKVLVFASTKDGLGENGVILGTEKTIEEIAAKKLVPRRNFNQVIATPEFMPKLAALGKILGPAGLMPNPKTGTVTAKPAEVVKKFAQGSVEFKTEPQAPVIHIVIGKVSQEISQLKGNLQALVKAVGVQGIEKIYLTPTMGPSVKVDVQTLTD